MISYFDVQIECNVIENNSETLVVLFPGIGYTCDKALLYYSKILSTEIGFDVLPLEYGFQIARKKTINSEEFSIVIRECRDIITKSLNDTYKNIIFIGKSIGTLIQTAIEEKFVRYNIRNIYLTPVSETVKVGIKKNSLVVSGNCDPMINEEAVKMLEDNNEIVLKIIDKANHSLNIKDDVLGTIEALKEVIEIERKFLKNEL